MKNPTKYSLPTSENTLRGISRGALMLVVGLVLALAGCGGGGGNGSVRPAPPAVEPAPPPTEPEPATPEPVASESELRQEFAGHPQFQNQRALEQVNAHYAYARGATGAGITIGIIDDGVDPEHPALAGKIHPDSFYADGYNPDFSACDTRATDGACLDSDPSHGTYVAGIMAGRRNENTAAGVGDSRAVHGVAFDAELFSVGILLSDPLEVYEPVALSAYDSGLADLIAGVPAAVTVLNLSIGLPGNIEAYSEADLRAALPQAITTMAQAATPAADRTIYVWAAGNAQGAMRPDATLEEATSVEVLPGIAARIAELRGHSLAVVATDPSGAIADFSSRCGIAGDYCLAAPGVEVVGPIPNNYCATGTAECYSSASGTSAAAPIVSGGIALLAQHYRDQLGNDEIVARLLHTANKDGIYADTDIYGQGFLDLDAATRPVGETRLLTSQSLGGPAAPVQLSALATAPAFGDALARGLGAYAVAAFDTLNAPFFHALGEYIHPAVAPARLEDRLHTLGNDPRGALWDAGAYQLRARLDHGHASFNAFPVWRGPGPYGWSAGLPGAARRAARLFPGQVLGQLPGGPQLGSLSLTRRVAAGEFYFGVRNHPGWQFGLYGLARAAGPERAALTPGTFSDDAAFANPYLNFVRDGASAGLSIAGGNGAFSLAGFHGATQYGERRDPNASHARGALAEYRFDKGRFAGIAVQAGWLTEPQQLAGGRARGAFGEVGAATGFLGLAGRYPLNDHWTALGSVHAGLSRPRLQQQGMLRDLSMLWTSTFSLGVIGTNLAHSRDRLALRLSQPLRVEQGNAHFSWASGRTRERHALFDYATLNLEPSGRQLDLELTYSRPWKTGRAHLGALATHERGHTRGEHDFALFMRYHRSFY
ncbi:MAG: S8 family serine peptidase [Gammaproteobacteria bacterium]|nr:S8 family serine peptidase [Gammaproteobacteria bacterium]